MQLLIHRKIEVAVFNTWWLLQLHYVEHVGDNTVIYPVEELPTQSEHCSVCRILLERPVYV